LQRELDEDAAGGAVDAEEFGVIDEVLERMFVDDLEAVAFRRFQDVDHGLVDDVADGVPELGCLALDQVDACERHG
jgi:hypothetical protein